MDALFTAFWQSVMLDLVQRDEATQAWVNTPGTAPGTFAWWCEVTDKQPQVWRERLLGLCSLQGPRRVAALRRLAEA